MPRERVAFVVGVLGCSPTSEVRRQTPATRRGAARKAPRQFWGRAGSSLFRRQNLCRCHLSGRPDRQFQRLAKRRQIIISWAKAIIFPKIDARRADADLL